MLNKNFQSEGHRDRCALIGLSVAAFLDMPDASPDDIKSRVNQMVMGLRVIATWASCDERSHQSRPDAMKDIEEKAVKSLGKTK